MLIALPPEWLHELAKGTVKTHWGKVVFKAKQPLEEADKIFDRQEQNPKNSTWAVMMFQTVAPLLAERLAIAEYKLKNPRIAPEAPEILNYREALELALKEFPTTNKSEMTNLLELLKNDPSMK
ncbi:MAG: hypothetical protein KHX20_04630 [Megasphaera sp.]|nr:hypothetical protein [Megasphaera sp.]